MMARPQPGQVTGRVDRVPAETVTINLSVRRPFAADDLLAFLSAHLVTGVEQVQGRDYFRSLRLRSGTGTVRLTLPTDAEPAAVPATIRVDVAADLPEAIAHCRRLLDLDADPVAIDGVLAADPALADAVAAMPGLRLPGSIDGPEILIRAMLGQQVSVAGAQTAASELVLAADDRLPVPDGVVPHRLPPPAALAARGPPQLVGPRAITADLTTAELTNSLVSRPGIGPWTAGYVAMRLLGDRDVLLTGDLVLRGGATLLGLPATPAALSARSTCWRPYRSYAGMHLWRAALTERARSKRARRAAAVGVGS